MNAKEYIKQLLSVECYSFSLEEITEHTDGTDISLKFELARLVEKKEIINLRKGFYLIIPPRYSKQAQLPIEFFTEKLFQYLKRNYYIGFYSAAKFYGASHQQVQRDYVMIEKDKMKNIKKKGFDISFFTTKIWADKNILVKKSDAGIFKISSPALTAVDLIHHQTKIGGLNRMLAILEELTEEIDQTDILELLTWYPHKSTLQRFGFLLEELHANERLSQPIMNHLNKTRFYPVLLSPKSDQNPGTVDNCWKVDVNIKLENDL